MWRPRSTASARDHSASTGKCIAGRKCAGIGITEAAAADRGAAPYRGCAETTATDATCAHPATETTAPVKAASATTVEAPAATMEAASATVEPAAHPLGHCGTSHHKRCRKGQRSDYLQICHFNSPLSGGDRTTNAFHRSFIVESSRRCERGRFSRDASRCLSASRNLPEFECAFRATSRIRATSLRSAR